MLPDDTDAEPSPSAVYPPRAQCIFRQSLVRGAHAVFSLNTQSLAMPSRNLAGQTWLQTIKQGQAQAMKLRGWVCLQLSGLVVQALGFGDWDFAHAQAQPWPIFIMFGPGWRKTHYLTIFFFLLLTYRSVTDPCLSLLGHLLMLVLTHVVTETSWVSDRGDSGSGTAKPCFGVISWSKSQSDSAGPLEPPCTEWTSWERGGNGARSGEGWGGEASWEILAQE